MSLYNDSVIWAGQAVGTVEVQSDDLVMQDARGAVFFMFLENVGGTYALDVFMFNAFRQIKTGTLTADTLQTVDIDFDPGTMRLRITPGGGGGVLSAEVRRYK